VNLIKDKWIPVRRADGTPDTIAPWEIGAVDNPVVDIAAPRPDFRGALYQFFIGLVQTAFAPEDDGEWEEKWKKVPKCEELQKAFKNFSDAFELDSDNGPAFMQDVTINRDDNKITSHDMGSLLIDVAGGGDYFIKQNNFQKLCENCTAAAIFTLQTNAPSGGKGHRTGMRGGGPMTTLIFSEQSEMVLWKNIWLNILTIEEKEFVLPQNTSADVFPWMGKIRLSDNDRRTFPHDVNELQMYWGLPRRIRLSQKNKNSKCDVCGKNSAVWENYRTLNHGPSYSSTWQHALSPYRLQKEKDGSMSLIAMKGKQGGLSYRDWLSLSFGTSEGEKAALIVRAFNEHKYFLLNKNVHTHLWCFGYDMENMKTRCWYEHTMPVILLAPNKKDDFIEGISKLIVASSDVAKILRDHVKSAWFSRPKDVKGDTFFISGRFWETTEPHFFSTIEQIRFAIESEKPITHILSEWRNIIISCAENIFDHFALNATDEPRNMKRIALAAKALSAILKSEKTKSINALKEAA
jgi:CRISPR system Cascade subunit CasA